jgi:hypothetical protein
MSKIIEQLKVLLRAGLTDNDIAEARQQIEREDFAKSEEARKPLFDKAVTAIRRGESTTQVAADLDSQCERLGIDSFEIACSARTHVEQNQKVAWEYAVQSFRDGEQRHVVENRLIKDFGFSPFDSEQVAYRAKKAAEQATT